MKFRRSTLAAGLTAAALVLTACGGGDDEAEAPEATVEEAPEFEAGTTMAEIAEAGTMTIGVKYDVPGFGLLGLDEAPEGFDILVAQYLAAQLGVPLDGITYEEAISASREDLIANGDVDMIVATYTINDTRRERITFAGPYYQAGQMIMTNADDDTIAGPEDLASNPDFQVCSVTGSTPAENIREYLASPGQLTELEGYDDCAEALRNGQVDGVTTDNVILLGYVSESDGGFQLVGEQFTEEPYGIGIEKGDVAFCTWINETLATADEEGLYTEWWDATAGQVEGTQVPELPEPDECA